MTGIGAPRARVDGPAKVRGAAPFLADLPNDGGLEGRFVVSGVAAARVEALELGAARGLPGVVAVFGPGELPALPPLANWTLGQERHPLQQLDLAHAGQPLALVLAESAAEAERAAAAVSVRIVARPPRLGLSAHLDLAEEIDDWAPTRTATGDVDTALAGAAVVVQGRYRTANRHHAAMEPAGAQARWTGDDLELWTSTQWVGGVREALSKLLEVPLDRVRVRAAHVGGGFGAKGSCWPHEIFAAVAARVVGRPVRIVLPREQSFSAHGYQPETDQDVTLAADRDGRLTAIRHYSVSVAAIHDDYVEHGSLGSRSMYACPSIETLDRIVRLHQPQPTFMRAPHEGPGMVALEIAMDELAERLGLDPLELRLRNYAERDPSSGKPFSSKALRQCYEIGAERFGWAGRSAAPRSMRDGAELVGVGMASALMATFRFGSSARVALERSGQVRVETASHDIGTGVATIVSQIAADALGID
ncbi:MAG: xanthine dehydrogenase family protein molybdopterin-binding subunit, partial [Gemmatimonadales bacterium]